jgi:hypothetical protein
MAINSATWNPSAEGEETGDALPMLVPSMLFWVQNVQLS